MNRIVHPSESYELLDSGEGRKLERFGHIIVSRPDPQVLWQKRSPELWQGADAVYVQKGARGNWKTSGVATDWDVAFGEMTLKLSLFSSKHIGVFPEHSESWKWIEEKVAARAKTGKAPHILNLFGYTGAASIVAAQAGAVVTHVDVSKGVLSRAKENANLSDVSLRIIEDDVRAFVEREIRRKATYDAVILDPPVYGTGGKKVWHIEHDLVPLLFRLQILLSREPLFVLLNGYAAGFSGETYKAVLADTFPKGELLSGEMFLEEKSGRLLHAGIYASWNP